MGCVMVNFTGQVAWRRSAQRIGKMSCLGVSVQVFLEEISI